jgi:hypothetical protein
MTADLFGHPPTRPIRHHQARCRDRRHVLGPRPCRAPRIRTRPASLAPHQPCRPPEARQVDQLDVRTVLDHRHARATRARRPRVAGLDMHHDRRVVIVLDTEHGDRGQTDQQLTDTRRVTLHRGSPNRQASDTSDSQSPFAATGGPSYNLTPRSFPKRRFGRGDRVADARLHRDELTIEATHIGEKNTARRLRSSPTEPSGRTPRSSFAA